MPEPKRTPGVVSIRAAAEHEVPLVLALINELAVYERLGDRAVATESGLRAALFGARRYAEVVFACVDAEVVGFALFFHNFSTFLGQPGLYLEDLYVRPALRGQGIGRQLLAWLARTAIQRGCQRLDWAVLDWNEPSIGFYRSLGAAALKEWIPHRLTGAALHSLAAQADPHSPAQPS
jgi:GNAT superfamily N-acetyltransferase